MKTAEEFLFESVGETYGVYTHRQVINAVQEFGNQRYNAALSEAIETLDKSGLQIFSMSTIRSVLEGLKIK